MITENEVYWITRMDYFQIGAFVITGILSGIALVWFVVVSIIHGDSTGDDKVLAGKHMKRSFIGLVVFVMLIIGALFIPSTKEMCAIKFGPMILNDKDVQEIPTRAVDLVNEWLDELRPEQVIQPTGD